MKYYISFIYLLVSALFLAPVEAREIPISFKGSNVKATLYTDDKLDQVLGLFEKWKERMAAQGIQVEFLLGAGEFRRALLHQPSNGPGDFEIFIHFTNTTVRPHTLNHVKYLFKRANIDIVEEVRATLGDPDKEIDIFYKDRDDLANPDKQYSNKFGEFDQIMGENSVNRLLFNYTRGEIVGDPEIIRELLVVHEDGKRYIQFLETEAVEELEKLQLIANTKVYTKYPSKILRQALRAIRLAVELAFLNDKSVHPNGNPLNFALHPSYEKALRGFELFFENVEHLEDIANYKLDDPQKVRIDLFLKIFRGRSNEELHVIGETLKAKFPRTLEIWTAMGLKWELLLEPRDENTEIKKLELRAVIGQAVYRDLHRFYDDTTGRILNPFDGSEKSNGILMNLATTEKTSRHSGHPPRDGSTVLDPNLRSNAGVRLARPKSETQSDFRVHHHSQTLRQRYRRESIKCRRFS